MIVLNVNASKQEISLGMKQVEENPWTTVEDKYPVGTIIRGRVRNLTNYGAFVEIEEGIDGLLHISDMSWTRKISHPSEMVKKGDEIETIVLSVDQDKKRVALGIKQLSEDPWIADIPTRYRVGEELEGEVTKITNFGVFVNIGNDLEGLMHISELSDSKVENPEEIVHVGDKVLVRIIKVNTEERKIGLSLMDVVERAETPPPAVERPEETEETKESDKAPETPAIEAESAPEAVEVAATESSEAEATVPPTAEETDAPQAEASPEGTAEAAEDPETKDSEG